MCISGSECHALVLAWIVCAEGSFPQRVSKWYILLMCLLLCLLTSCFDSDLAAARSDAAGLGCAPCWPSPHYEGSCGDVLLQRVY